MKTQNSFKPIQISQLGLPRTNSLNKTEFDAMLHYLNENGATPLWRYVDHLFELRTQESITTAMKLMEENMNYFTNLYH